MSTVDMKNVSVSIYLGWNRNQTHALGLNSQIIFNLLKLPNEQTLVGGSADGKLEFFHVGRHHEQCVVEGELKKTLSQTTNHDTRGEYIEGQTS